jgi:hypothetical protein
MSDHQPVAMRRLLMVNLTTADIAHSTGAQNPARDPKPLALAQTPLR